MSARETDWTAPAFCDALPDLADYLVQSFANDDWHRREITRPMARCKPLRAWSAGALEIYGQLPTDCNAALFRLTDLGRAVRREFVTYHPTF